MRKEFVIKKIETSSDKVPEVDEMLPKIRSVVGFVAPSGVGKTNLIINLLNGKQFYRGKFDLVFLFSPTHKLDTLWEKAKGIDVVYDCYDEEALKDLVEQQKELIREYGKKKAPEILIILDDCVAEIGKIKSYLADLTMRSRHYCITIWLTTQKYNKLPHTLRNQVSYWILFRGASRNKKEREAIADEIGQAVDESEFLKYWEEVGKEAWNFLVVSMKSPINKMFRREFQQYLL